MSKFKVGDIVVCIDDQYSGPESGLAHGMMYTILETNVESSFGGDFIKVNKTPWFWNPNRFELVRQVPNHKNTKIGQKVRVKTDNSRSPSACTFRGQICTIKDFHENWVSIEEDSIDHGLHWDEIEFIKGEDMPISDIKNKVDTDTSGMWHNGSQGACGSGGSPMTPQEEIDYLLGMANNGLMAMEKLQILAPGNIQFSYDGNKDWASVGKLKDGKYRIKPKPTMEPWVSSGREKWTITMGQDDKSVHVGCKQFNTKALRLALVALLRLNLNCAHCGVDTRDTLYATKGGVQLGGHTLRWADAEKLLNELNKLEIT